MFCCHLFDIIKPKLPCGYFGVNRVVVESLPSDHWVPSSILGRLLHFFHTIFYSIWKKSFYITFQAVYIMKTISRTNLSKSTQVLHEKEVHKAGFESTESWLDLYPLPPISSYTAWYFSPSLLMTMQVINHGKSLSAMKISICHSSQSDQKCNMKLYLWKELVITYPMNLEFVRQ